MMATSSTSVSRLLSQGSLWLEIGTWTALVTVILIFATPLAPWVIGGLAAAGLFMMIVMLHPPAALVIGILLSSLYLVSDDGVGPGEIAFFAYFGAVMVPASAYALITGNLGLDQPVNRWVLLLTLLIPAAAVLGRLNGGQLSIIAGDLTFYSFFFGYFAVWSAMRERRFIRWTFLSLIAVCLYVLVQNLINYQQILLEATMAWQALKARSTTSEILMVFGATFFFSLSGVTRSTPVRLASLVLLGVFVVGLVITQSRGYWIGCLLALAAVVLSARREYRSRLLAIAGLLGGLLTIGILIFLRDELLLVLAGLLERFLSIGDLSGDISLMERVLESRTIMDRILHNPVAGYGLGVTYDRYYMIPGHLIPTSYIHNGYLSGWFKTGLAGLTAMLMITLLTLRGIRRRIRLEDDSDSTLERAMLLTMFGVLITMLLVNLTSPVYYSFDGWLLLTLFAAYAARMDGGLPSSISKPPQSIST